MNKNDVHNTSYFPIEDYDVLTYFMKIKFIFKTQVTNFAYSRTI